MAGADDAPLFGVVDVAIAGTRLVVAEASSQSIRVFDDGLQQVARLGRDGDGPAEFRGLAQIFAVGDSGLESPVEGNLRYGLPRDWRLQGAVVVDCEGMRRSLDDAGVRAAPEGHLHPERRL